MDALRQKLSKKTVYELIALCKSQDISGYSGKTKDDLIEHLIGNGFTLVDSDNPATKGELQKGWWKRWHNHVYGWASVIGLALTLCFSYQSKDIQKNITWQTTKGTKVYAQGHQAQFSGTDIRWMNTNDRFLYVQGNGLYISDEEGASSIMLYNNRGNKRILVPNNIEKDDLSSGGPIFYPEPSHDDRFIAIGLKDGDEIHLGILDGKKSVFIPETQGTVATLSSYFNPESKSWAPYKNSLAFVANFGNEQVLPVVVDFDGEDGRWSPEVNELIYSAVERVAWSPSGEKLAFAHGGGGIYVVTIYDRFLRRMYIEEEIYGSGMQWLKNGELMFITAEEGGFQLATYSQNDMQKISVKTATDKFREFEVSKDGQLLAYWEEHIDPERSILWVKHLSSGKRKKILEAQMGDDNNNGIRQRFLSWNRFATKLLISVRSEIIVVTQIDFSVPPENKEFRLEKKQLN